MKNEDPDNASWVRDVRRRVAWVLGIPAEDVGLHEIGPSDRQEATTRYRGVFVKNQTAVYFDFDHHEIDLDLTAWSERLAPGLLVPIKGDG